jgi:exonuclease V
VELRSPLDRWRSGKLLSVSDFTSPAWCEVQYFYSLSKYGKVKKTKAMKQGTVVHKKLEDEIHDYQPVEILTKEDNWGLKIWNVIQGLRTLRSYGITRELSVWGTINGEGVAGVIDELSMECPDPVFQSQAQANVNFGPTGGLTLKDYFSQKSTQNQPKISDIPATIYVIDTKTRTTPTLPKTSALRPVKIQLSLYHQLITQLSSSDGVSSSFIFARHKLRPLMAFSPTFMQSMSGIELPMLSSHNTSKSMMSELESNFNLDLLWKLMLSEFRNTFPSGALSPVLHVSFRAQSDGSLIGGRSFMFDETETNIHTLDELSWWRGERKPRGVNIDETFKCRICEFAATCEWRKDKEKELNEKAEKNRRFSKFST